MKTKIQQAGDYSLEVVIDPVEVGDQVHVKFQTYMNNSRFPDEPMVQHDMCMSKEEFALMCRAFNVFALENC